MDEQSNVNVHDLRTDRSATDRYINPPAPIHGHACLARIPSKSDPINMDVVLIDRGPATYDRWVTGLVGSADATPAEWFWGNYYHNNLDAALTSLAER